MFLTKQGTSLSGFYATLKTIKLSEEKKYIAIQLSQSKHVYNYGLSFYDSSRGFIHSTELFDTYFTVLAEIAKSPVPNMNNSLFGNSRNPSTLHPPKKAKQNISNQAKEINRQLVLKRIQEFEKSKAGESKVEIRLQNPANLEEREISLDLSRYFKT